MASKPLDAREASWLDIARRVARPQGARLAEVRAALADYTDDTPDPRALWEALVARGLASEEWATRGPSDVRREGPEGPFTRDAVESIVAVASDPEGVAAVEALARELSRRLAPWNEVSPERVVWRTVPVTAERFPSPTSFAASPAFAAIDALFDSTRWTTKEDGALRRSVERAFRAVSGRPSGTVTEAQPPLRAGDAPWRARFWDRGAAGQQAIYHTINRALWQACTEHDLAVPRRGYYVDGKRFREFDDPAEVLLEVWRTGYVIHHIDDAVITVHAPEYTPPEA